MDMPTGCQTTNGAFFTRQSLVLRFGVIHSEHEGIFLLGDSIEAGLVSDLSR
jgi:hypothetical protein